MCLKTIDVIIKFEVRIKEPNVMVDDRTCMTCLVKLKVATAKNNVDLGILDQVN